LLITTHVGQLVMYLFKSFRKLQMTTHTHTCFQVNKCLVYAGQGSEPEWNETFVFTISEGTSELVLKIVDHDTLTDDDYLGKARWVTFIFI